jgi:GT2 family glycosyltransferase
MQLSAYVPCCNNAAHIRAAVEALQQQSLHIDDVIVIDDASVDGSAEIASRLGVRVIRHDVTHGRGAVHARGVIEAKHELIITMGAPNVVPTDFAARAVRWFGDQQVAAVCARIVPPPPAGLTDRWRARHLFLVKARAEFRRGANFASGAAMFRRSAALTVGNFDSTLIHTEDYDFGNRLLARGYDVLFDPDLHVIPCARNSMWKVLERHWRWYAGSAEPISLSGYLRAISYSLKVMVPEDLHEGDWGSAAISALCPHHHFWLTIGRRVMSRGIGSRTRHASQSSV